MKHTLRLTLVALLVSGLSLRMVAKTMGLVVETLRRHVAIANSALVGAASSGGR